eukprot:CAMPEP_0182579446 /NCGR_PEP_ID=MMETSP1324-20130603/44206_1 /TAXON_ID=236786 /ORGANISM="Florenciella sp., Strain RCC1587" /LENGTH=75 /DNA_ID=CAMNT_0024795545 /DNA_START=37 /DNA_END=260 /DNA_ORIENTATION=+
MTILDLEKALPVNLMVWELVPKKTEHFGRESSIVNALLAIESKPWHLQQLLVFNHRLVVYVRQQLRDDLISADLL